MWTSTRWSLRLCALTLIAWGSVSATSIAAASALTPPGAHQEGSTQNHQANDPGYPIWDPRGWNPNTVIAVAIGTYAVFAIFHLGAMRRQSKALANIESANLFLYSLVFMPNRQLRDRTVSIGLRNYGRTPAIISAVCVESHVGKTLPRKPRYTHVTSLPPGQVIMLDHPDSIHVPIPLTEHQIDLIEAKGDVHLWAYGYVAYRDVMHRGHEMRFCLRFAEEAGARNFVWVTEAPPAYTKSV